MGTTYQDLPDRIRRRAEALARSEKGELKAAEAATLPGVVQRQPWLLPRRYRAGGAKTLVHRATGRRSNHALEEAVRRRVPELERGRHAGREPQLLSEHPLAE